MAVKKKSQELWQVATENKRNGRPPSFETPEELTTRCQEYFQWAVDNPLWEARVAQSKGEPKIIKLPKLRALTIKAMCLYVGISHETWIQYGKKEKFSEVVREINAAIYAQKFEGASADLLNANIIARDLGLKEKSESKTDNVHTINITRLTKQDDES